ncbi:hypothetical protein KI387_032855, partial [Taxus chinensis]
MGETKMKFKFKKLLHSEGVSTPNGYRLATVAEIRNNLDNLKKWGLPIKTITCSYDFVNGFRNRNIRLLDGWMTSRFKDAEFQLHEALNDDCYWNAVVKEKFWDSNARKCKNKESALYSFDDGNCLRKQLYDGITLSKSEGVEAAWMQACLYNDVEVLYWLWKNTYRHLASESLREFERLYSYSPFVFFLQMMAELNPNARPSQELVEEATQEALKIVRYAMEVLRGGALYVAATTELFIEIIGHDFVETATNTNVENIPIFTKLLSVMSLHQLENQIRNVKPRIAKVLVEAVERGYRPLVNKLFEFKDDISQITQEDRVRALREAVRKGDLESVKGLLDLFTRDVFGLPDKVDETEKTLFHYALPHLQVFELLQETYKDGSIIIVKQDKFGRNVLHWAAKGNYDEKVVDFLLQSSPEEIILNLMNSRDDQGRTPLHIAASKGDMQMIEKLLSFLSKVGGTSQVEDYIKGLDFSCRTALQMAAGEGHVDSVKELIRNGSNPLKERDAYRKTALHYAAQAKDPEAALATCKALLEQCKCRSLLLWASAAGIGTADEMQDVPFSVKDYIKGEKRKNEEHLLKAAAINNNAEMAWELLNRGADMEDILDPNWKDRRNKSVEQVIADINRVKKQGQDQPTLEDKLGRNDYAEGLAALFINRFTEPPITVGIVGEWGMGKSSLMIQTEKMLLITAAQLAFPNLLPFDQFVGAKKISLNRRGRKIYKQIERGVENLVLANYKSKNQNSRSMNMLKEMNRWVGNLLGLTTNDSKRQNLLVNMLKEYQPQYHNVYKSLACINNDQMVLDSNSTENSASQKHALRGVPRILTVRYNAWHYNDQYEAWAGLGFSITKEIENSMTRSQWLSTCWRYTWGKQRVSIWIQVFLPCLISIFLAPWVAWMVWMLLKQDKFRGLKYGSIPLTILAIVWFALKSVISVVKPVSTQMMGYITSPDHKNRLGYQEEVIDDIKFLKKELGKPPNWFFSLILGEWCCNWFGLFSDKIIDTSIPKFMPASEDQIRIIAFVDDLDRCQEKVILQVLSAVNLVLAECKINVIVGMDKKLIERAIRRNFEDTNDEDLAEKFICKIIQIPLSLPEPTLQEMHGFLEHRLGHKVPTESAEDHEAAYIGSTYNDDEEEIVLPQSQLSTVPNREFTNEMQPGCEGIFERAIGWFGLSEHRQPHNDVENEIVIESQHPTVPNRETSNEVQAAASKGIMKKAIGWFFHDATDENLNLLKSSEAVRLTREILLPNYSREEACLLYKLTSFASGYQKLPREWTRLLNYHKLAWYVLSQRGKVYSLPTWKEELVAWVFICWQWKHEMNLLIK